MIDILHYILDTLYTTYDLSFALLTKLVSLYGNGVNSKQCPEDCQIVLDIKTVKIVKAVKLGSLSHKELLFFCMCYKIQRF